MPPRLTIGMPTFNNERTITRAIESLLGQSFSDFELIISDDGSSDRTLDILQRYSRADTRIRLVQQPRNLNYGNFGWLLENAGTEFFVFAAGDDWWETRFLEQCLNALASEAEAICAVSRVLMHPEDQAPALSQGTASLRGPWPTRLYRFLDSPADNSRMYGVFRTAAARAAFPKSHFHAYDWAFCARSLQFGTHVEIPDVLMHREVTPHDRYFEYAKRDSTRAVARYLPVLDLSRDVLRLPDVASGELLGVLWRLNKYMHGEYVRVHHPRAWPFYRRLLRV
jgi:glycosyltransferase involved in cell wall biosynthesis